MSSGIYKIENCKNGKLYVGSAIDLYTRLHVHKHHLKKGTHHSRHLQRAWNKYGKDCFVFEVIEEVPNKEKLVEREQYYLDLCRSYEIGKGYNICVKANSTLGFHFSEESKKKISEGRKKYFKNMSPEDIKVEKARIAKMVKTNTGRKTSKETKEKIRLSNLGKNKGKPGYWKDKNLPEETKRKISETKKGVKVHTKESKEKLRKLWKGRKHTAESRVKMCEAQRKSWIKRKKKLKQVAA